jgi:hypothetical protein
MKHIISTIYQSLSDVIQVSTETTATTGQQAIEADQPLAASATPLAMDTAFSPDKAKAALFIADVNCTVELQDVNAAEVVMITLVANEPFVWHPGLNPPVAVIDALGDADIESLEVINTSSPLTAGTLKIRILTDPS